MKKIGILVAGMVLAGSAFAQANGNTCSGNSVAGTGGDIAPIAGGASFVVKSFAPKCSANVYASFVQNAVAFGVGSASSKGKNRFKGTSGGGAIAGEGCSGVTCVSSDSTAGLQALLDAAT